MLRAHKFIEIQTMEVLQMEHVVKQKALPVLDLDFVKQKKVSVNEWVWAAFPHLIFALLSNSTQMEILIESFVRIVLKLMS